MKKAWTIHEAITWGTTQLTSSDNSCPRLDAEILLSLALSLDRASLFAYPERPVAEQPLQQYRTWIDLRKHHYPIQYIRGTQEFFGREFIVNPNTLIPRPETELLVETCLDLCRECHPVNGPIKILDIGTGSGCIAVTLSAENPCLEITATDIDPAAIQTARINADILLDHPAGPAFFISDLGNCLAPGYNPDFIVSNPPYVGFSEAENVDRSVLLHEPGKAVFSGETGLECFARIFSEMRPLIKNEGFLILEIGAGQADALEEMGRENRWLLASCQTDLAGITRCLAFSPS